MRSHFSTPVLRRLASIAFALLATLAFTPAHSAWQPGGVRISAHTPNDEDLRVNGIVSDGAQGAIVSWVWNKYLNMDYSDYRSVAQHVDVSGNIPAPWPANGVSVRTWYSDPGATIFIFPRPIIPDGLGGAYCPEDFQQFQVEYLGLLHFYRVGANGAVTGLPNYSGTGVHSGPSVNAFAVDADGSGGAVYMALSRTYGPCCGPNYGAVYAQRVDPQGNDLWSPSPYFTRSDSLVGQFDVLSDGAGGAFFAWGGIRPNGVPALYVQHLDATGAVQPGWPAEGRLVSNLAGQIVLPWGTTAGAKLAPNGAGGVFVVWVDRRNGQLDLFAHDVLADGSLAPGIPADGRALASPQITDDVHVLESDAQGGVFVVRVSSDNVNNSTQVRLYRLDPTLLPYQGWPSEGMLLTTTWSSEPAIGLAADGQGGAFVAFRSLGVAYPAGMIGQHLAGDGSPAPGWTSAGYLLTATGFEPRVVRSGNGAIVVWNDFRPGANGIYAQRLVPDGPVAVQLSLVGATAEPGNVSLHWYATGAAMLAATVERRTDDSDWEAVGTVNADGAGHLRYEDGSVAAGRFGYRVTWSEDGSVRNAGEVWVDVPDTWRLALSAPRPNPGSGSASFAVTLAERAPASIELLDLQGRRVAHRDLGMLDLGSHVVTFDEAAELAPGIYLARLTQGVDTRTVRLVRIR